MVQDRPGTHYDYQALAPDVLAVAVSHDDTLDWAVYIKAVPSGMSHYEAYRAVAQHGTKLAKELAELMFPMLAQEYLYRA